MRAVIGITTYVEPASWGQWNLPAALIPYAKGQKPVIFHAEHRNEILDQTTNFLYWELDLPHAAA